MTAVLAALQPAIDEAAEFGRCLRDLCPVQKRVLTALMHRLIAMEEANDAEGALVVIDEVRRILGEGRLTHH
ncbi:hypothetical protein CFHF_01630 [Caulobacter flavus]|jgi:hypothetical protein|uniref:Uncharacterized protein n=3 Tax=Caulobacter TaxID=75 RepID=A0A2T9K0J2_9CAUL|nr:MULTISPECIES: hypothetical protein [Caulobacter]AYV46045.1 hypothetical protein C1707_07160 [Caulobacter flavus]MDG2531491.1 hypothetical protein [Caulobacter endophyticus]NGM51602.1 hypothetical protein [Caulobacter sp. 602-2]PLR20655.1 hypothetical protein CFHF_01630 [Caulobacter flavus]PVM89485.1 hypothetical protein DDF65_00515 [Caulobacter radicis]